MSNANIYGRLRCSKEVEKHCSLLTKVLRSPSGHGWFFHITFPILFAAMERKCGIATFTKSRRILLELSRIDFTGIVTNRLLYHQCRSYDRNKTTFELLNILRCDICFVALRC